jgi:RecJ-like exonuclease
MNYCKICGKKLELTPEYDMCMECQGKQHRTFILPNNDSIATNHINTEMTAKEALFKMEQCGIEKVGLMVSLQEIILKDLSKLEKIKGYVNATDIIPELKIEIIKNILKESR